MTKPIGSTGLPPTFSKTEMTPPKKPWHARVKEWFHDLGELIRLVGFVQIVTSKGRVSVLRQNKALTSITDDKFEAKKNAVKIIALSKKFFPQKELAQFGLSQEDTELKELESIEGKKAFEVLEILTKYSIGDLEIFSKSPNMLVLIKFTDEELVGVFAALRPEQRLALLTNEAFNLLGKLVDAGKEKAAIALVKNMSKSDFEANFVYKEGQKKPPKQWHNLRKIIYVNSLPQITKSKREFLDYVLGQIPAGVDKTHMLKQLTMQFTSQERAVFENKA